MRSHRDIINLWPSAADLARDLDIPGDNVRKWKFHNRIPGWFFSKLEAAAARRGIEGVTVKGLSDWLAQGRAA